ncbi:hypothetical protein GQ55_4G002300 [Panicum hallii var. hallii]|uniref:Uncharacterized protein n=1 Tax=Panicum hallii var. hallii TaxID=1504633 RepID=A0A2T7DTN0_9POAL|nr:hypothetical protein GQ55_4G002300 [Panicum hallii var. hallii]
MENSSFHSIYLIICYINNKERTYIWCERLSNVRGPPTPQFLPLSASPPSPRALHGAAALAPGPRRLAAASSLDTHPPPAPLRLGPPRARQAQTWEDKMTASGPDEPNDKDFEGRPSRLGLGAKVAPGVKRAAPTSPVERKLLGKVNAQKRKAMEDEN